MASGDTLAEFLPQGNEQPSSSYAVQDVRNGILVLAFANAETAIFRGILPTWYGGGGLTLNLWWMAGATTGDGVWGGAIERGIENSKDHDADAFATEQLSSAVTTNATSGKKNKSTITFSSGANMDSLAAGEPYRLKLTRKSSGQGDTMTGKAQFTEAHLKET